MKHCWSRMPDHRPSFEAIHKQLAGASVSNIHNTNAQLVLCSMLGIVQGLEAADPSSAVLRLAVEEAGLP